MCHECSEKSYGFEKHEESQKESCGCNKECECGMPREFLELADEAWMEALKDKIREKIHHNQGEYLNRLADLISEANHKKWNHIIRIKHDKYEFKQSLMEFFKSKLQ